MPNLPSASFGLSGLLLKDNFTDVPTTTNAASSEMSSALVIIIVIIIIFYILLLMATYKLTSSALQTILCLIFGIFYLTLAFIYYGFAGYKFMKKTA